MALAKFRGFVFACDESTARRESGLLSVKLTATLGILKKAVRNQIINLEKGHRILTEMIKAGFYSPVKSLDEIKGP